MLEFILVFGGMLKQNPVKHRLPVSKTYVLHVDSKLFSDTQSSEQIYVCKYVKYPPFNVFVYSVHVIKHR